MNLLFLLFLCLTFVSGIKSTESAFESRVNEKDGTVYSSNAKADTLNHSNWNGKSESGDEKSESRNWNEKSEGGDEKSESGDEKTGEEAEVLTRLEIELEELLQSHLEVQIQQQAHQHQEHQPQRAHQHQEYQPQRAQRQQEYDQQEQEHQQQQHRLRMRR